MKNYFTQLYSISIINYFNQQQIQPAKNQQITTTNNIVHSFFSAFLKIEKMYGEKNMLSVFSFNFYYHKKYFLP
jgi:hypothetical protein